MMRSLYSGITGLRNHQTRMDVIGNNIANVNTVGFKYSRTVFEDLYSQTLSGASAATTTRGGTNPLQVGLGVTLGSIDVVHTQSAAEYTGRPLDTMLGGDGFFVIKKGTQELYTRAGNFYTDAKDMLVTSDGSYVQAYKCDPATGDLGGTSVPMPQVEIDEDKYSYVEIDDKGYVVGVLRTTGAIEYIARLQVATFSNNEGLAKVGGNYYRETTNSGLPNKGVAGEDGIDILCPGALEMSNVDLAQQFTDMIVTQRGFQANSRTITVSDTMLEELINLKR